MRLDIYLTEKKLVETRSRAQNLIKLGFISVNGTIITKTAQDISEKDVIEVLSEYAASLGSLKLEKALKDFNIDLNNKVCLDVGASNGGFTDVMLKNGAKTVYALDVGKCALPKRLYENINVVVMDETNARNIKKDDFLILPQFVSIDVSFISLKLILPAVYDILETNSKIVALIKPQFECGKKYLTKTGILLNEKVREKIVYDIKIFAETIGFSVNCITPAPHPFEHKNQEYLIYLCK